MPGSGYDWAVLAYVLLAVLAVVVIGLLAWGSGRGTGGDETHRFDRARELTREWSRGGQPPADGKGGTDGGAGKDERGGAGKDERGRSGR